MSEHFVEYINIEKYKCFEGFSAKGFKRVNLISGKNNVGKTALIEALFTSAIVDDVQRLIQIIGFVDKLRSNVDYKNLVLKEVFGEKVGVSSNVSNVGYIFDKKSIVEEYDMFVNDTKTRISIDKMAKVLTGSFLFGGSCYISSLGDSQMDIIHSFEAVQKKDREPEVNGYIQSFDESIENVKIIGGDSIECKVIGSDGSHSYRKISMFGDGLRHYLSIISDLFSSEGRYLFIDELDNGIHYSSLDKLWEIILTVSKELNVQVFAITHSKECIVSYCRVAEKLEYEDISFTTLVRNKEQEVKAIVKDYDMFTKSIHSDREVRGW